MLNWGGNLISEKVFNLCALGNVTTGSGYIWIFRPINDKNHLPPYTGYHENSINNTDNMSSLRRARAWLTWLHHVTWGYSLGVEKWRGCDKTLRSCLLMPGWKETNKMLVMQWDCWIESAHWASGTELFWFNLWSSDTIHTLDGLMIIAMNISFLFGLEKQTK